VNGEFGIALAFVTGILGALHCIGMCSGLNAGFFAGLRRPPRVSDLAIFHAMRIGIYTVLGVSGALLGRVISSSGIVGKAQGLLMMLAGGIVVFLGLKLGGWIGHRERSAEQAVFVPFHATLSQSRTHLSPLVAGLLNGLVPCSLVFSVAIHAAATADPLQAGLLMLAFGAGTLPTLLTLSLLGATVGCRVHGLAARFAGLGVVMLGLWTFYQGYVMYDVIRGLANW